jgi:hypothetical protein
MFWQLALDYRLGIATSRSSRTAIDDRRLPHSRFRGGVGHFQRS